jgi:hypothetical protein
MTDGDEFWWAAFEQAWESIQEEGSLPIGAVLAGPAGIRPADRGTHLDLLR